MLHGLDLLWQSQMKARLALHAGSEECAVHLADGAVAEDAAVWFLELHGTLSLVGIGRVPSLGGDGLGALEVGLD
eukprot:3884828-Pyramimonas_sp.AAC.1